MILQNKFLTAYTLNRLSSLIASFGIIENYSQALPAARYRGYDFLTEVALLSLNPTHEEFKMKTSARNQFTGTVSEVLIGAVNAEVHVGLKGGETIVASITKESVETLESRPAGSHCPGQSPANYHRYRFRRLRVSARNQLPGTVTRLNPARSTPKSISS